MAGVSTIPSSGVLGTTTSGQPITNQASTNYLWAQMVLQDAGLPTTQSNLNAMVLWMQAEEPPSNWFDRNNPLNASLGTTSTDGTGSYPSLTVAAQQTAAMIRQSNMKGIYSAFSSGQASGATIGAAIIASPWASGHYGGNVAKFTGTPPPIIAAGSGAVLGSGASSGSGSASGAAPNGSGCGAKGGGISLGSTATLGLISAGPKIGTACQLKALTGGLLMGVGGGILLVGATLIAAYGLSSTKVGQAVTSAVPGPIGAVSKVVGSSAKAPTPPPAPRVPAPTPGYSESDVNAAYEGGRSTGASEGPSESTRRRWRSEGFSGEGAARRNARPGIAGA